MSEGEIYLIRRPFPDLFNFYHEHIVISDSFHVPLIHYVSTSAYTALKESKFNAVTVQKQLKYSCVPFQERPLPKSARLSMSKVDMLK